MARDMVVRISEGVRRQFAQERYLEAEYDRAYSLTSLILFFFSASTVGWLWEVFLHIFIKIAFPPILMSGKLYFI